MDLFNDKIILTVSRLTSLIKGVLEDNFEQLWVEGEVSNLSQPQSGHIYFTLKDTSAMIRCFMFRSSAKALKFRLEEGMALILKGRLSLYDQRGEYQIVCEYLEPRGAGALQLAFLQMKERLAGEGVFDEAHKQALPALPRRVGIVTSPTGAAIHDILNVLGRRYAALEILLYPVRVQGGGAAAEIARGIADMNRLHAVDVLIVGRGGGAPEDLWAFNEEVVARAVHASKIPIISAVGHETDWTICDFVADLRAPTPSAAAELVCASSEELQQQLDGLRHRLQRAQQGRIELLQRRLEGLRRALHDPTLLLGHLGQRIDDLSERLERALHGRLARLREQVASQQTRLTLQHPATLLDRQRQQVMLLNERAERHVTALLERLGREQGEAIARLDGLSPLQTLRRGYAVVERIADGAVVCNSAVLACGDRLRLRLGQGSATCCVEDILL